MFEEPHAVGVGNHGNRGAFGVSIGCNQRSSGAFDERREAALERKVRNSTSEGLAPPAWPTNLAFTCIQNIGVLCKALRSQEGNHRDVL
jgi:hypothetical protein